jgi:hypothetical protein
MNSSFDHLVGAGEATWLGRGSGRQRRGLAACRHEDGDRPPREFRCHRGHPVAVDDREIGMAKPGRRDLDQNLALTRPVETAAERGCGLSTTTACCGGSCWRRPFSTLSF